MCICKNKMAKSVPPASKKAKRSAPVSRVSAEERAKQFEDLYTESGILFCRYCKHIVDYSHIDTIKDHHKSKKHCARKGSRQKKTEDGEVAGPSSRQVTLIVKSKQLRVLDYIKLCTFH